MNNSSHSLCFHQLADPILILEDIKENQDLLKEFCNSIGIACKIAENGKKGLELIEKEKFSLYIVDLMMPVMDGRTFIKELKVIEPDAVILIQSALDSAEVIIEVMKMGVFDYIVKPLDPELFQQVIKKSIEYKSLRDMENNLINTAALKIRNQMDWLNYKENRRVTAKDYAEIKSIYNLKTSLTQGTGFGALLTVIDLILNTKKDEGDSYSIDKEILNLLTDNFETCNAQLNGLHDVSNLLENLFNVEESDARTLINEIPGMLKIVLPFLETKNLSLNYPELKSNCKLNLNIEKMSLVIEEVIINAYKYSVPDSTINMFAYIKEGYFWLCVMNEVSENPYGGIPRKYEKLVLEPFFRLLPADESIMKVEKFGLGLGLTVADNITRKHGGLFLIRDVKDHIDEKVKVSVLADIMLPVIVD
ncbi:MAG: response regulator [Spirochaetes bacterium]|nr:response regulator [Spirochaetota bacterium]